MFEDRESCSEDWNRITVKQMAQQQQLDKSRQAQETQPSEPVYGNYWALRGWVCTKSYAASE